MRNLKDDRPGRREMKFVLEVDMGDTAFDGKADKELGRILRYWGGNLHHYDLKPGDGSPIYDSAYNEVGTWTITATDDSPERPAE
jgi:hypothetical protein